MLPGTNFIQIVLSPARHNSIFTVLACLWIQFSLEHFFFCPLLCPCNFWHFAKVLPTCLFSLLSIDVMAALLSLSIVCKTHIIPVFSVETETLCLLSVLHVLSIREEVVLSCLIGNLRCTSSYVLSASSTSLCFSIGQLFTP